MAQEVYQQIQLFTDNSTALSWNEVKGTVQNFLMTGKAEGNAEWRWQDKCVGVFSVFCDAEKADKRRETELRKKTEILGKKMQALNLSGTDDLDILIGKLRYNQSEASEQRKRNLTGLAHEPKIGTKKSQFPGVLLLDD